ncbi:MAG TPA: hypothetical protein VGX28_08340 [Frankiaceae bacterium]|jgi:hypothetical protein|nr:hypothetical protein [Frankiaceae bacterium]
MTVTTSTTTAPAGRFSPRTTPGRFRLVAAGVGALAALAAVLGTLGAATMRASTHSARDDSGPVLVATQRLVSSLAEADAAATAAFFSGANEDPEQRRLYEQALARATEQVAGIASLAGDDATTLDLLGKVSVAVTRYAGLVEAARAGNRTGSDVADDDLVRAVTLLDRTIGQDAQRLTEATRARLSKDERRRSDGFPVAVTMLALALVGLVVAQALLYRSTRRILNPLLVLATCCVAAALAWVALAETRSGEHVDEARRKGYDSIAFTARLQTTAFGAKADETLALITGDRARRRDADAGLAALAESRVTRDTVAVIRDGYAHGAPGGLVGLAAEAADTPRERAAAAEMAERWQRYRDTVDAVRRARTPEEARAVAVGPAAASFTAFNYSVEAVLAQNRDQFLDGLGAAASTTSRLPVGVLLLPIAGAVAALAGFQMRINEYR